MGKSEILSYPILKTYFKKLHIPVFRNDRLKAAKSFIHAKKAVAHDWSLVIFPEGGIPDTNKPQMIAFKEGAFKLAKKLNIPIVPITFTNNHLLFSDPSDVFGPAHPGISRVYIHPHFSVETMQTMSQDELMIACFDRINHPLKLEYPSLVETEKSTH
jgi:1-acyl-sn-glycerol-3-phosphate acyltransferase